MTLKKKEIKIKIQKLLGHPNFGNFFFKKAERTHLQIKSKHDMLPLHIKSKYPLVRGILVIHQTEWVLLAEGHLAYWLDAPQKHGGA